MRALCCSPMITSSSRVESAHALAFRLYDSSTHFNWSIDIFGIVCYFFFFNLFFVGNTRFYDVCEFERKSALTAFKVLWINFIGDYFSPSLALSLYFFNNSCDKVEIRNSLWNTIVNIKLVVTLLKNWLLELKMHVGIGSNQQILRFIKQIVSVGTKFEYFIQTCFWKKCLHSRVPGLLKIEPSMTFYRNFNS